ncbi:hypothetical protein PI126_g9388 [Phytophthora idaei]|nr:hypothetical protein PI126_g9388 [Phytophthora idaei]
MVEKLFGKLAANVITVDRRTEMGTSASSVFALVPVQEQHQVDYRSSHPAPRADDRHMQGPLQLLYAEHRHGCGRSPRGNDRGRSAKRRFASPPAGDRRWRRNPSQRRGQRNQSPWCGRGRSSPLPRHGDGFNRVQVLRTINNPMDLDTGLILLCVVTDVLTEEFEWDLVSGTSEHLHGCVTV